jgi:hypothetical protein
MIAGKKGPPMPDMTAGTGTKRPEYEATPAGTRSQEDGIRAFLDTVYMFNKQGRNHLAIDEILRFFDDALLAGNLDDCREALRRIDEGELSASMMKTVLVITGKAKAWLPERDEFFTRAMGALSKERGLPAAERLLNKHR